MGYSVDVSSHTLTDREGRTECDWLTKLRLQLETQHCVHAV